MLIPSVHLVFLTKYFQKANARKFDVFVEGSLVLDDLDIFAVAPGSNVLYVVTVSTFVTDGAISIDLVRNTQNPQINGIEVFDDGAPIPAPTISPVTAPSNPAPVPSGDTFQDIAINCGGTFKFIFLLNLLMPVILHCQTQQCFCL